MRLAFLAFVAAVPMGACSTPLVTAPSPPIVPAPTVSTPITSAPTIVIRGTKSVSGVLFIVDGVPVAGTAVNSADIEQVEIIKGASAATLYGNTRGCPPIIIRTKRQRAAPSGRR
jgi:outer membrane receptor protein involved in Fe transport